jgi:glycosyltransferase involved in cell wall biosynthesis
MPPGRGSVGGRGFLLMKELVCGGDKVVIITSDSNHLVRAPALNSPYMHESIDGVDLWWIRTLKYKTSKSIQRALSWLHFEWRLFRMPKEALPTPDVLVISSLSLLTILNGFLLRRRYRCRLIFEIRDIWPLTLISEGDFKPYNPVVWFLSLVERWGYRHADLIVGTMPNLSEHVTNILGYRKPVACIPMGFDGEIEDQMQPLPDDYVRSYIPRGKFIVSYVGSIGISNALDPFFACAAEFTNHPEIHFLVVGDGNLRAQYQEQYGHLQNISFGPEVSKDMVQSVLKNCDLLYFSGLTERWKFGQSLNKLIDYMLSGKPILASYSGFPSMINEAECGYFITSGDVDELKEKILDLASMDRQDLVEMGLRGRRWILENRNYRQLAQDYRALMFLPIESVKASCL